MEVLKDKLVKAQTGVDLFEQVGKKCIFALVIPRSAKEWPRTCLRRVEKSAARTYAHTLVTSFLHIIFKNVFYGAECILWPLVITQQQHGTVFIQINRPPTPLAP